ncbi:MAG: type II toxin-antitoxin system RelE/ParE family toxin [Byssovorax sp.]
MSLPVVWTPRAVREATRAVAWWVENRPYAPELLEQELAEAISRLRISPLIGTVHKPGIRRLVLERTRYGLYYAVEPGKVRLLAVWSSLRGRAPRLR